MFSNARIFVPYRENDFEYLNDYASVMQFVSKNKVIPEKLAAIAASSEQLAKVAELKAAMSMGNLNHDVFANPDCQLYVFYLFRDKQIEMTDFLSLSMYLNVLSQHTDKQPIKEKDIDLKIISEVTVVSVAEQFDEMFEHLTKKFFGRYAKPIAKENLIEAFAALNPLNRCVLKIKDYVHPCMGPEAAKDELSGEYPFLFISNGYIYMHLAGVCEAFLKLMNPEMPVKMAPVFGNVALRKLFKMHQKGFHPVSLYSYFVESNVTKVHGERLGLLETIMHDLTVHVVMGNFLLLKYYRFLYLYVLPAVETMRPGVYASIKHDYDQNVLADKRPSSVLDLVFAHEIRRGDDPDYQILLKGLACAVGNSYSCLVKLYQILLPMKEEIENNCVIDIVELFHDEKLLQEVAFGKYGVGQFAVDVDIQSEFEPAGQTSLNCFKIRRLGDD